MFKRVNQTLNIHISVKWPINASSNVLSAENDKQNIASVLLKISKLEHPFKGARRGARLKRSVSNLKTDWKHQAVYSAVLRESKSISLWLIEF